MFPGNVNPKKMKQMMKQMGMKVEQIEDVEKIVIHTPRGNYIFDAAEVTAMTMQGMTTYQIAGQPRFEEAEPEIPEDDVKMVAEQANVAPDAAREALVACKGDIAEAILQLTGND
ncbi:MAG TPA: nascent polypeptide-associated complex protein [Methanoregulaceae archaeon]|jgi:nascent polypeptide-associated complex subunit alpha|nr:MAG: nascent polypeptide-associated complex protein [Methanolinea sp. SDB]MCA9702892.1 nascent polypeptide-associated complex protein [Methanolinea sp.]MDD3092377.1 nascent polypeptide-associated complex protein [Methanoregulaceae archaeon]MDD5049892.1 nascent polypeptide-associated complex protein [Methanoregulaceae archaeon]MDD5686099.1 nascent polypeptide-associated complex protein [Methanoregulaceae archaeon]